MPAKPRSEIFDPDKVGVYHCWNRLVRRRHLFGLDQLTGKNYNYRKEWVRDRMRELAGAMAIDVLDYAILDIFTSFCAIDRTLSARGPTRKWLVAGGLSVRKERTTTDRFPTQNLVRSACCCKTSTNTGGDFRIFLG